MVGLFLQWSLPIKIMQENRSRAVGRSLPNSIFQKFEGIYNQEQRQLKQNQSTCKRLLAKIMQKQQHETNLRKQATKQIENIENNQMDLFWKNEEERLRARERQRRLDIDEARKANNASFNEILTKSMSTDPYHLQKNFRDDLAAFQDKERQKKEYMKQFYYEGMLAESARQQRKRYDRQLQVMIQKKKQNEDRQLNARRGQFFNNWRNKHFQEKHPDNLRLISEINHQKQIDKALLEEAIAVKGGHELNQRVAALRAAEIEEQIVRKEDHLRRLKEQTEENNYKAAIDKYLQINYQRKRMDEMGKALDERDLRQKQLKKEANNQHLSVLRGQMKPRVLLQQSDKIEPAGIGSPAHIGKIVHDDRIRQLKWIERSFLQELNHG